MMLTMMMRVVDPSRHSYNVAPTKEMSTKEATITNNGDEKQTMVLVVGQVDQVGQQKRTAARSAE